MIHVIVSILIMVIHVHVHVRLVKFVNNKVHAAIGKGCFLKEAENFT